MKTLLKFIFSWVLGNSLFKFNGVMFAIKMSVLDDLSKTTLAKRLQLDSFSVIGSRSQKSLSTYKMLNHPHSIYKQSLFMKNLNKWFKMMSMLTHSSKYEVKLYGENEYVVLNALNIGQDDEGNTQFVSEEMVLIEDNLVLEDYNSWQNEVLSSNVESAMLKTLEQNTNKMSMNPEFNNELSMKTLKQLDKDSFGIDDW